MEENDIFPIGSLVVIGESFVVQVIDHGSLILKCHCLEISSGVQ